MTDLLQTPKQSFVGKVFTVEEIDQLGTFDQCWTDFKNAGYWPKLDAQTDKPNRSYMLQFSPYSNFVYYVGSILPVDAKAPKGLEVYELPAGTIGKCTEKVNGVLSELPVQTTYAKGLEQLDKAGFPLPAHIGQTDHPYYLESYPVHEDGSVDSVHHILYINLNQLEGYDEFD